MAVVSYVVPLVSSDDHNSEQYNKYNMSMPVLVHKHILQLSLCGGSGIREAVSLEWWSDGNSRKT